MEQWKHGSGWRNPEKKVTRLQKQCKLLEVKSWFILAAFMDFPYNMQHLITCRCYYNTLNAKLVYGD